MGYLSRVLYGNPERRGSFPGWLVGHFGGGTAAGPSVSEESSLRYAAVFACVKIISEDIASLPLITYRQRGRSKERARDHALYPVLHDLANPELTSFEWRELMLGHLLLWGNGYSEIEYSPQGQVRALWPLRPDSIEKIERNRQGTLEYHYRLPDQTIKVLPWYRIHHIKGAGGDGIRGWSPIRMAARQAVGLGLAAEEFGARFFSNGARPGILLKAPGKLTDKAYERLRESFASEHQGLSNAHRTKILEEGLDIATVGIPPNEAQFLECVVPGTLMSMADGTRKQVEDIRPGDEVIGWKDGPVKARVAAIGTPPIKPLVRLTTSRGRVLTATADHPCMVKRAMRTRGGRVDEQSGEWVAMGQIETGNYIRVGLGNVFEGQELDSDIAWLLGALTGDGYLRSGGCSFTSNDAGTTKRMNDCLEAMGGCLKHSRSRDFDYEIKTGGKGRGGSPVRKLLNESGLINCGAENKRVPAMVLRGGPKAWAAFLSGYLDADGSVNDGTGKGQHLVYWSSINRLLLEDCQHMLAMLGINSAIYQMSAAGQKEVQGYTSDAHAQWGLYVTGASQLSILASLLTPAHSEKSQKLARLTDLSTSRYRAENWLYDRIETVEPLPEGETVGVEIEGVHTHITGGLVTHNTRKFQVQEIARIFRVPPHLLADLDRATFSNIEHQSLSYVIHTLRPWLVRHEQAIYRDLLFVEERPDYFVRYQVAGLLRGDTATRYAAYTSAITTGWMTRNEARDLEDLNPLDGLDDPLVPMNMMEAGAPSAPASTTPARSHEHGEQRMAADVSEPEPWDERANATRSNRQRIMRRSVRLWEDAAGRLVKREVADIRRGMARNFGKRSQAEFETWLASFYEGLREALPDYFAALMDTYAETIWADVAAELEGDPVEWSDELREWIATYLANLAAGYTVGGEKQLRALLAEAEDEEAAQAAIEERLSGWEENRAQKTALEQAFEAGNALALVGYVAGGVTALRWSARGDSCPLCKKLDGRRVRMGRPFVEEGDTVDADGVDPLPIARSIKHGPLHSGCDCVVVAG